MITALQHVLIAHLDRSAASKIPFWTMATAPLEALRRRAETVAAATSTKIIETSSLPGAGSTPGTTIPSVGIVLQGNRLTELRNHGVPIIARLDRDTTVIDFRSVDSADDSVVIDAVSLLTAS